jgi:hypothetical protein
MVYDGEGISGHLECPDKRAGLLFVIFFLILFVCSFTCFPNSFFFLAYIFLLMIVLEIFHYIIDIIKAIHIHGFFCVRSCARSEGKEMLQSITYIFCNHTNVEPGIM